jgi:hypothetical protein
MPCPIRYTQSINRLRLGTALTQRPRANKGRAGGDRVEVVLYAHDSRDWGEEIRRRQELRDLVDESDVDEAEWILNPGKVVPVPTIYLTDKDLLEYLKLQSQLYFPYKRICDVTIEDFRHFRLSRSPFPVGAG